MKWLQSLPINILILLLLVLMGLPAIGLIIHSGIQDRKADLDASVHASTYLLNNIASDLHAKVDSSRQIMEMLSILPEVRRRDRYSVNQIIESLLRSYPIYSNVLILDRHGISWAGKTPGDMPVNLSDRKAFKEAMSTGRFSAGEYTIGRTNKKQLLNFALPLRDQSGIPDGAIMFGIHLEQIGSIINNSELPAGTSFAIFDHNGVFLYRTINPEKFIGTQDRKSTFDQMKNGPDEGVLDLVSADGIHRRSAYRKIRLEDGHPPYAYVRGGIPIETALEQANRSLLLNLTIMFTVLVLVLLLTVWMSRRLIVQRIVSLEGASRNLAAGNLNVRIAEMVKGGELGRLGSAFDEMAVALAREHEERDLREQALKEKSELVDLSHDAIILRELDGRITFWNQGAEEIYGYSGEHAIGRIIHELLETVFPRPLQEIVAELEKEGTWKGKLQHTGRDGRHIIASSRWVLQRDDQVRPWRIMELNTDITDLEKAQDELLQLQKLESLGVLAGGIAHDFNNLLTGIMGNISLARTSLDNTEKAEKSLLRAENASLRAAELAFQLLTFAKGNNPVKKAVVVRTLLDETVSLVLSGSNVRSVIKIQDDLRPIEADEGQIHQAFNNIVINALQAMHDGGTLTVTAENVRLDSDNGFSLPPGEYVRCVFSDTGHGISSKDQNKIFDPYFTTKDTGKGLGLASTYSIISKHGGNISLHSIEGKGTSFEILLPASDREPSEQKNEEQAHIIANRETASILVMDDEEMIRDLTSEMLKTLGYRATTCSGGEEAITLYADAKGKGEPFSAVIMDLTVPGGMGGKDAAKKLLEIDPKAQLIVSSGYSNDPVMADHTAYGFAATMRKPYSLPEVTEVLNRLL